MSDKNLTELEWKKFSKGKKFQDSAFLRALAALEKAERAKSPVMELEALDDIEGQAETLRKAGKADKELGAYLDGLDKALGKQRKLAEMEAKKAVKAESSGDEEDTPDLLTTKMVPLLRQVKKGDEMSVMLAVAGKDVAVLMSRRAISPARRKLLTDYLDGGTPKFFAGTCLFEEKSYTFVLKTQAGGLAKKIRAALLKQVELRLKVRVRGEDPDDIDDDGELAEDVDIPEDGSAQAKGDAAATTGANSATPTPAATALDPLKAQFEARYAEVEPRVLETLKAQRGDVSKIRAVAEFVREKGEAGQYKPALAGMDSLVKLLDAAPPTPPTGQPAAKTATPTPSSPEATAFNARLAALMPTARIAIAAAGPTATDIKLKVSEAGMAARKQDFGTANGLLDDAEALIEASGNDTSGDTESTEKERLEASLAEAEKRLLDLLSYNPADASRLRSVYGYAAEQAADGEPAKAIAALKQLDRLMDAAEASLADGGSGSGEAGYDGIVAYRKTLIDFRGAMSQVKSQVAALKAAIPSQLPDQQDLADELAGTLEAYNAELLDIVDEAMKSSDNKDSPVTRALADQIDDYIETLASDPLVAHADSNPFGAPVSIKALLGTALADIRKAMPAFA